jgi:hypothetical protein
MKNRDVYQKDPLKNKLLNEGVAEVSEFIHAADISEEDRAKELRTLRYELETFVCDGEYARGLEKILRTCIDSVDLPQQPGVWVSGFYGSGKSHLVKMLRALWVNLAFPPDNATARGLANAPVGISDLLKELDTTARRIGGLHAASGKLGAGAGDNIRMAVLGIVFRSVGLSEQYPMARFELWLREQKLYEAVRTAIEAEGKTWHGELRHLYASPLIAKALLNVYPDFASSTTEARKTLREQFPNVQDVTSQQMVDAIRDALTQEGKFPFTLIALDEVQQYIGENQARTYSIQEVTETCCKRFGGRLVFVGTGQTALSGTPNLQKLMGRFTVPIELSDTDVDAVIRKVVLAKKPGAVDAVESILTSNLGEISRHLAGTRVEHTTEDQQSIVSDYPILPVRRRFWVRVRRALDHTGAASLLRNQLMDVFDAVRATAEAELGTVVAGDFVFEKMANGLLRSGALSREVYEHVTEFGAGSAVDKLKGRLCALIYLIGKLPRDPAADAGICATEDVLADLLIEDLPAGSAKLRKDLPSLLGALERAGLIMRVGDEYRLQTRESSIWNDEYRNQLDRFLGNPQRIAQERIDLLRKESADRLKGIRISQGKCKEARDVSIHFSADEPADLGKALVAWFRDGWDEDEKAIVSEARAAGNTSPTIYVYLPRRSADELKKTLASLRAATATLQVRGVPTTTEGEEARVAMQTREADATRRMQALLDEVFGAVRVFQGGGQEVTATTSITDAVKAAAENALVRLYPNFDLADHTAWSKVIERAKMGSEVALEAVEYQGDVDKHPVTAAILKYVAVGKKGADVRKHFEEPDFGWPRDAIDGGIYALLATGHLRATDTAGKTVDAKALDRAKITQTSFRIESTTVTTIQRIQIRKLLQDVGVTCNSGEELGAMPQLFEKLRSLAGAAGGDEPRPARPDTEDVNELANLVGNEQLIAIHARRDALGERASAWLKTALAISDRVPRWLQFNQLLEQVPGLAGAEKIQEQADAILDKRMLLSEPDPVPGLLDTLTQLLRDALVLARDTYKKEHDAGMERLHRDENWQKLQPDQRHALLVEHMLTKVPEIQTGTSQEVLSSLRTISLATWADRTAALPTRFGMVLLAAAKLLEPDARYVKVTGPILRTEADVRAWLQDVERRVIDELKAAKGGPVIIS